MSPKQRPADRATDYEKKRTGTEKLTERLVKQGMDRRQAERLAGDSMRENDRAKER